MRIDADAARKLSLADVLEIVCSEVLGLTGTRGSSVVLLEDDGWLRAARVPNRGVVTGDPAAADAHRRELLSSRMKVAPAVVALASGG